MQKSSTSKREPKKKTCVKCGEKPCICKKTAPKAKSCKSNKACSKELCIQVTADIGWGNMLFIRGEGGSLSWDKGVPLENLDANHWVWKSKTKDLITFKLLVNDTQWSGGENYQAKPQQTLNLTPTFSEGA